MRVWDRVLNFGRKLVISDLPVGSVGIQFDPKKIGLDEFYPKKLVISDFFDFQLYQPYEPPPSGPSKKSFGIGNPGLGCARSGDLAAASAGVPGQAGQ